MACCSAPAVVNIAILRSAVPARSPLPASTPQKLAPAMASPDQYAPGRLVVLPLVHGWFAATQHRRHPCKACRHGRVNTHESFQPNTQHARATASRCCRASNNSPACTMKARVARACRHRAPHSCMASCKRCGLLSRGRDPTLKQHVSSMSACTASARQAAKSELILRPLLSRILILGSEWFEHVARVEQLLPASRRASSWAPGNS